MVENYSPPSTTKKNGNKNNEKPNKTRCYHRVDTVRFSQLSKSHKLCSLYANVVHFNFILKMYHPVFTRDWVFRTLFPVSLSNNFDLSVDPCSKDVAYAQRGLTSFFFTFRFIFIRLLDVINQKPLCVIAVWHYLMLADCFLWMFSSSLSVCVFFTANT